MIATAISQMDALELVLTAVGVLGLLTQIGLLVEANRDLATLEQTPTFQRDGARHLVARGRVGMLIQLVTIFLVLVVASSGLLLIPHHAGGAAGAIRANVQGYAIVFIELSLTVGALLMRRDNVRIIERIHSVPKPRHLPRQKGDDGDDATGR